MWHFPIRRQQPIRVFVLGTGQMGSGIARLVLTKQGLELVGAYGRRPDRAGLDLGLAIGLERKLDIPVSAGLTEAIRRTQPEVAIHATCSRLRDAAEELSLLLRHGIHVISIAEELAYPTCASPALSEELERLAIAHGVSLLGTGINPGFVLDVLVITLTAACADIQSITATRVNDLSPYGPTVLRSQGVGLTPEAFRHGLESGAVVGHFGFCQSIHMIADALGWPVERVEETREPILSTMPRATPFVTVRPGQVAGCVHKATAYRAGQPVITLIHPQQIHPQLEGVETGDRIDIRGTPNVRFASRPEIPGGQGTIALAVNMIPHVLNASPGLHSMADLPVPAAMLGDARGFLRKHFKETGHG